MHFEGCSRKNTLQNTFQETKNIAITLYVHTKGTQVHT